MEIKLIFHLLDKNENLWDTNPFYKKSSTMDEEKL
jgi:hypothetical protein